MRSMLLIAVMIAACKPMDPSGDPLAPVAVVSEGGAAAAPAAPSPGAPAPQSAPIGPQGDFDFEGEDRDAGEDTVDDGTADLSEEERIALQAKLYGIEVPETPTPAPAQQAAAPTAMMAAPPAPRWDPDKPISGSFGVTVTATMWHVNPPQASIVLPNGDTETVEPGDMLPDAGLVVLAIGKEAVQFAEVRAPGGFYATVNTTSVPVMYPVKPADAP